MNNSKNIELNEKLLRNNILKRRREWSKLVCSLLLSVLIDNNTETINQTIENTENIEKTVENIENNEKIIEIFNISQQNSEIINKLKLIPRKLLLYNNIYENNYLIYDQSIDIDELFEQLIWNILENINNTLKFNELIYQLNDLLLNNNNIYMNISNNSINLELILSTIWIKRLSYFTFTLNCWLSLLLLSNNNNNSNNKKSMIYINFMKLLGNYYFIFYTFY